MSRLPLQDKSRPPPNEPQILGFDSDAADKAFEVLTASATRAVLSIIYEQPSTPTEIHDEVGTSLQTVHHHLGKLEDARLIEPAGVEYSENYEQPSTPTEIHDEVGTSLQTVHHHLGKLEDARLIEPAGVEYSENGTEMTLYAPVTEAVVLFAGRDVTYQRLTEFF